MNINELTIGEAKELSRMFGTAPSESTMLNGYVGKYVIVRSRNEGINSGYVSEISEHGVALKDARRIWWHKPKDPSLSWYEGVSISGVSDDSKLSPTVSEKLIVEDYSITICTNIARESIQEKASHAG